MIPAFTAPIPVGETGGAIRRRRIGGLRVGSDFSYTAYRGDDGEGLATRIAYVDATKREILDVHFDGSNISNRRRIYLSGSNNIDGIVFAGKALIAVIDNNAKYIDWHPVNAPAAPVNITGAISGDFTSDNNNYASLFFDHGYVGSVVRNGNAGKLSTYRWKPPLPGRPNPEFVDRSTGAINNIGAKIGSQIRPLSRGKRVARFSGDHVQIYSQEAGQERRFSISGANAYGSIAYNGNLYLCQYFDRKFYIYRQSNTTDLCKFSLNV